MEDDEENNRQKCHPNSTGNRKMIRYTYDQKEKNVTEAYGSPYNVRPTAEALQHRTKQYPAMAKEDS
jgi:hypothetical protein